VHTLCPGCAASPTRQARCCRRSTLKRLQGEPCSC
jgi:hypothetical protein